MKRTLKFVLYAGGAAAAAAAFPALIRRLENEFIFWPLRRIRKTPHDHGLVYRDVTLEPAPGIFIHGWFIPHPSSRAAVIYFEGNAANRSYRLGHLAMLHGMGCSVLMMDYEGYGDSDGKPSEVAVYRDAHATREWLQAQPSVQGLPLILYGESLGGAVAIQLARQQPPQGLIVDHSFSTMTEMIDRICRGVPLSRWCLSEYNSIESIRYYHGPVLILHGEEDRFIPIEHGRRLFEAANEPKAFIAIPGAGHNHHDLLEIGGEKYSGAIQKFVDSVVSSAVS